MRLPAPVCVMELPEIRVRFVPRVAFERSTGAVLTIAPVETLPITSVPAVMLLNSTELRPRFELLSAPPRSTPAPRVWMVTVPDVVAFTVPELPTFSVLAVSVIGVAAERMPPEVTSIPMPAEVLPGVVPDTLSVASVPVVLTLEEKSR